MKAITQVIISLIIVAGYSIFAFAIFPAMAETNNEKLFRIGEEMSMMAEMFSCEGASKSEASGKDGYEAYSTEKKTYTKDKCDYLMQKYDKQCENFELDVSLCAKDSNPYEYMQSYLEREGLKQ
jgi:hypothetical protein